MKIVQKLTDIELAQNVRDGAVGIIPTDTIYGLVASVMQPSAVRRIYDLKGRDAEKPCIILVDSAETIAQFGVPQQELARVAAYWPAPLSVIFSHISPVYSYLCRDIGLPPFRVPADAQLREFLARSGPIIAPSANRQGEPPVQTVGEAQHIFGNTIDFYADGGTLHGQPSTVVKLEPNGAIKVIRQGVYQLK